MKVDRDIMAFEMLKSVISIPDNRTYTGTDGLSAEEWQAKCTEDDIDEAYRITQAFINRYMRIRE